jgi:hypothetical protein
MITCPICDSEVVASEGAGKPFYWRDTNEECGYIRDIDALPPKGGVIVCSTSDCGAPVEYGKWGDKPAWRCVKNKRHHQRVARTHLLLPRVRALVPESELRRLDKQFRISASSLPRATSGSRVAMDFES